MALVQCESCGKNYSDTRNDCFHCGTISGVKDNVIQENGPAVSKPTGDSLKQQLIQLQEIPQGFKKENFIIDQEKNESKSFF